MRCTCSSLIIRYGLPGGLAVVPGSWLQGVLLRNLLLLLPLHVGVLVQLLLQNLVAVVPVGVELGGSCVFLQLLLVFLEVLRVVLSLFGVLVLRHRGGFSTYKFSLRSFRLYSAVMGIL